MGDINSDAPLFMWIIDTVTIVSSAAFRLPAGDAGEDGLSLAVASHRQCHGRRHCVGSDTVTDGSRPPATNVSFQLHAS